MAAALRLLPFWPKGRKVLVKGEVMEEADMTTDQKGHYERVSSVFRNEDLRPDDVTPGRWYLFACYGCPWAHRAIVARSLLGLEEALPLVATEPMWPLMRGLPALATGGWRVTEPLPPGALAKAPKELKAHGEALPFYLWRLYVATDASCTGRVTVPLLWDSEKAKVVNNESSDILRILNSKPFKALGPPSAPDLRPDHLVKEIDEVNERLYGFNNGVYRCGFAGSAPAFLEARAKLFETIAYLEERLATRRYLMGDTLTECDVRCFTTLVRFEFGYFNAFRCNTKSVRRHHPNLQRYLRDLYSLEPFRKTCRGMLIGYPVFYFIIAKWQGRRVSNTLRLAEVAIFAGLFALAPDTPAWRYWLATLCCAPLRILNQIVDPLPNASIV